MKEESYENQTAHAASDDVIQVVAAVAEELDAGDSQHLDAN